jgi:hypothetical protein
MIDYIYCPTLSISMLNLVGACEYQWPESQWDMQLLLLRLVIVAGCQQSFPASVEESGKLNLRKTGQEKIHHDLEKTRIGSDSVEQRLSSRLARVILRDPHGLKILIYGLHYCLAQFNDSIIGNTIVGQVQMLQR